MPKALPQLQIHGTNVGTWLVPLRSILLLQTAVAHLRVVTEPLANGTASEAASIGVLSEGYLNIHGGMSSGITTDMGNSAIIETDALVRTCRCRVLLCRRSKALLAGTALGSH
jgi:hypothetical protein